MPTAVPFTQWRHGIPAAAWGPSGLAEIDLATGELRAVEDLTQELAEGEPVTAPKPPLSENGGSAVVGTITPTSNLERAQDLAARRQYPEDALNRSDWHDWEWSAFHRLFLGGEPGPKTASEDDLLLACLIVRGKVRDPAQIETIMRAAEIARVGPRQKWDANRQYVQRTIAEALRRTPAKLSNALDTSAPTEADRPRSRSLAEILKDPRATQPPAAVVPGLAWAGRITLVAAREGVGKSTLFSAAAAAVTTGAAFLGDPCARGSVLWVLVEEHLNDLVIRALRFETAQGNELHVLERPDEPLTTLEAEVQRLKPALVVVDTLHAFAAPLVKDKSQSDDWLTVMAALDRIARTTNTAVLMAAQALKGTGDYRDSGAIGHGVDVVLNLLRPDRTSAVRVLERQKARWDLPDLHVELVDDEYRRTSAKASGDGRREALLAKLTTEPQTAKQLAGQVDRKQRSVEQDLQKLHAAGQARRVGSGKKGDPYRFHVQDSRSTHPLGASACVNESKSSQPADARMCGQRESEGDNVLPF